MGYRNGQGNRGEEEVCGQYSGIRKREKKLLIKGRRAWEQSKRTGEVLLLVYSS